MPTQISDYRLQFNNTNTLRDDIAPRNPYVGGYGYKIPTQYRVMYCGRIYRVYCMQYSNSGSIYIKVKGRVVFVDIAW